jgi:hypothetical protein
MKAPAELTQAATAEQLLDKRTRLEEQIATRESERERLREEITRLVIHSAGSDLLRARERQLEELNEEIRRAGQHREILRQAITEAIERERKAKFEADQDAAKQKAEVLEAQAEALTGDIMRLARGALAFRETLAEFDSMLPGSDPSGFQRGELSAGLAPRIAMALYVASQGALRPPKIFDSWYETKQAGHGDLLRLTNQYTTVALRRRVLLPLR